MNILNKVALQGLKKNRTRTIVTVIGVILSSALITAVISFGVSLLDYMAKGAAQTYGDWHAAFLDADASFVQARMRDESVTDVFTFDNIGYAMLEDGQNPKKPYLFIAGFDGETFDALPLTLVSGRLPENSSEILLSGKLQTDGGVSYQVGDTLSLSVGNRIKDGKKLSQLDPYTDSEKFVIEELEKTYTVVGICRSLDFEGRSFPGYTLITRTNSAATADSLSLFLTLENPYKVYSYLDKVAEERPYVLNNGVLRYMGISKTDKVVMTLMYSFGGIVITIIMIGSIFLIYNSFSISLSERTRQIGILSSVGATAKQIRNSVRFEGLCIAVLSIPVGVLIGLGSIRILLASASENFASVLYAGVPLTLHISALAIAAAVIVSFLTILISAYIPAKKAASAPVMECIRQTNTVKLEAKTVKTSSQMHFLIGLEGILALKNFRRNKKRYRSIVLSLMLSIVLFISTSSLTVDLQKAAPTVELVDSDISFSTQAMSDKEMLRLYDKVKNAAGVYESSYQIYIDYLAAVPGEYLSNDYWKLTGQSPTTKTLNLPFGIRFFDDGSYLKILNDLNLPAEEYTGENAKALAVAQMQDNPNFEKTGKINDMFKDFSLELTIAPKTADESMEQGKNVNLTFIDFVPPDTPITLDKQPEEEPYIFWIMFPWSLKDEIIPAEISADTNLLRGMTFLAEDPSQSTVEIRNILVDERVTCAYVLLNATGMLEENRSMIFIANLFAYTFIAIISLIAVANIFNTISTNIKLRRRELAMLRSMGMSNRDFNKMMRFECIFYGMKALLFGLPIAIAASFLIHRSFANKDDFTFVLPLPSIGISIFSVLLVIFITMMYAVSKIKKENIIDALRDDMT